MKISLVAMRVIATRTSRPASTQGQGQRTVGSSSRWPAPTPLADQERATLPCPARITAVSWEDLVFHIEIARGGSRIATTHLRSAVRIVAHELRSAGESWESIYGVLLGAVAPMPPREVKYALELELYASRAAAIVAHMHSWVDVERLAELGVD